jgi:hypothetical protein
MVLLAVLLLVGVGRMRVVPSRNPLVMEKELEAQVLTSV